MVGGGSSDIYVVDDAGDAVLELAGGGTADRVRTTLSSYALGAEVENLTGIGTGGQTLAGNGLGNDIDGGTGGDLLSGEAGADTLDGAAGADTLAGGLGNDVYLVGDLLDLVLELAGEGTDSIRTALTTFSLAGFAEVETLIGTSAGAQTLSGNSGDNLISGGGAGDSLLGGGGLDTLAGNNGADTLDGGTGADSLVGGASNDTYIIDDAGDLVLEAAGGGTGDTVRTSLASYTLGAEVERLVGTGSGQVLAGNALANAITGSAGADSLSGGADADRFYWGDATEGGDTIAGFSVADDRLVFLGSAFGGGSGALDPGAFAAGAGLAAASTATQRFLYDSTAGVLRYDGDGDGGAGGGGDRDPFRSRADGGEICWIRRGRRAPPPDSFLAPAGRACFTPRFPAGTRGIGPGYARSRVTLAWCRGTLG